MCSYNLEWILTIMFNVAISGKRKVKMNDHASSDLNDINISTNQKAKYNMNS